MLAAQAEAIGSSGKIVRKAAVRRRLNLTGYVFARQ
jgi:hypothetical protein